MKPIVDSATRADLEARREELRTSLQNDLRQRSALDARLRNTAGRISMLDELLQEPPGQEPSK